jgi:cytidylate kinase
VIVAIDGQAGAGKSTVARVLAERLHFRYLDTGAMYRALTWLAVEHGLPLEDEDALAALASASPVSFEDGRVLISDLDVTDGIRATRIDRVVSTVARHPAVREVMRARQRVLAATGDAVIEGRDIGSVVFPEAELKVYLTADPEVRAKRRHKEVSDLRYEEVAAAIAERDARDEGRAHGPLVESDDAITVDTTGRSVDEVVAEIVEMLA